MQVPSLEGLYILLLNWVPRILYVIAILIVGWAAGRVLGKAVAYILDKIGVDDLIAKTSVGKAIEKSGIKIVTIFDVIARWFVYLIAIIWAADALGVKALVDILWAIAAYLPHLAAGVVIILFGFIGGDIIGDLIISTGKEREVEWADVFGNLFKFVVYVVVLIIGLKQMMIDVTLLEKIVEAMTWGLSVGAAVGAGIAIGWGLKDVVKKYAEEELLPRISKKE